MRFDTKERTITGVLTRFEPHGNWNNDLVPFN